MPRVEAIRIEIEGRDFLELSQIDGGWSLRAKGCLSLLEQAQKLRAQLHLSPAEWELPSGTDHVAMMFHELIVRARGDWQEVFAEEELCHCRAVPTRRVESAIMAGAHDPLKVSRCTSASTACGTCRPDVERILAYRLGLTQGRSEA